MEEININPQKNQTTPSRMAGDERRSQILTIAVQLFSQRGFRGTTTREIATAAGVSEAIIFRHFATKHDLYRAIIDYKSCNSDFDDPRKVLGEFISRKDDWGVFYNLARHALDSHDNDPEFMRLLLHSALENHELAQMFFDNFIVGMYELLGSYIAERQKDGAFREMQPRVAVRAFVGMMIHHSLNKTLWDKQHSLLKLTNDEAAREFTEILLRGIKSENQS